MALDAGMSTARIMPRKPKSSAEAGRSPRVTTRVPETLLTRYRESARRRHTSVSEEVRRVLTEHAPGPSRERRPS